MFQRHVIKKLEINFIFQRHGIKKLDIYYMFKRHVIKKENKHPARHWHTQNRRERTTTLGAETIYDYEKLH
jgi:hypothetical protein